MSVYSLPAWNAFFNSLSFLALLTGYVAIRQGRQGIHRACMATALCCSATFLTCYLVYHAHVGHVVFAETGALRAFYLLVLTSHTILAIVVVPLVVLAVRAALTGNFERHRRFGRWLFPIWAYVSITGVLIYFLLRPFLPLAPAAGV